MKAVAVGVLVACAVLLVGIVRIYLKHARRQAAADRVAGTLVRFDDLGLTRTQLLEGYGPSPTAHGLEGLRASVDSVGQLSRRVTLTRVALVGVIALALRKREDDRSVFLTIEGPSAAIVREIPVGSDRRVQRTARQFAAAINSAAQAFERTPKDAIPRASRAPGQSTVARTPER